MTQENDANDRLARACGLDVVDHPKGRGHDHSRYVRDTRLGVFTIWRTARGTWRTAYLRGGRYRDHESHDNLALALRRPARDGTAT